MSEFSTFTWLDRGGCWPVVENWALFQAAPTLSPAYFRKGAVDRLTAEVLGKGWITCYVSNVKLKRWRANKMSNTWTNAFKLRLNAGEGSGLTSLLCYRERKVNRCLHVRIAARSAWGRHWTLSSVCSAGISAGDFPGSEWACITEWLMHLRTGLGHTGWQILICCRCHYDQP